MGALLGVSGTSQVLSSPNSGECRDQRVWVPGSFTDRRPVAREQKRYFKSRILRDRPVTFRGFPGTPATHLNLDLPKYAGTLGVGGDMKGNEG